MRRRCARPSGVRGGEKGRRASEARRVTVDELPREVTNTHVPVNHHEPTQPATLLEATFHPPPTPAPRRGSSDPTLEQVMDPQAEADRRRLMKLGVMSAVGGAAVAVGLGLYLTRASGAPDAKPVNPAAAVVTPPRKTEVSDVARVELTLEPAEARVLVDGAVTSVRDGQILLEPGHHRMRVQAEGHVPEERVLDLGPGERRQETVKLEREAQLVSLRVSGKTAGLLIDVDGRRRAERTPATLQLPPGEHTITLTHPRTRKSRQVKVTATGDGVKPVGVDL